MISLVSVGVSANGEAMAADGDMIVRGVASEREEWLLFGRE